MLQSTHLHTHTCAHLQTDTHIQAIHLHPLMQPTTLRVQSKLKQILKKKLKGHCWRDLALIQLFLLEEEPVGLSLAM